MTDSPYMAYLDVVAALADAHISAAASVDRSRENVERAIVELVRLDCPVDEISAVTGWSPRTIKTVLHRTMSDSDETTLVRVS
jgi:DNA-directed RNA polymerase specialized sigma24 family protein